MVAAIPCRTCPGDTVTRRTFGATARVGRRSNYHYNMPPHKGHIRLMGNTRSHSTTLNSARPARPRRIIGAPTNTATRAHCIVLRTLGATVQPYYAYWFAFQARRLASQRRWLRQYLAAPALATLCHIAHLCCDGESRTTPQSASTNSPMLGLFAL